MDSRLRVFLCAAAAALIVWGLVERPWQAASVSSKATIQVEAANEVVSSEAPDERLAGTLAAAAVQKPNQQIAGSEPVAKFQEWTGRYLAAKTFDEQASLVSEGIQLAKARRPVFKAMIRDNPRRALESAVPMLVRQDLPQAVVAELETRVGGRGALRVYQGVGGDNHSPVSTVRVAEFADGKTFDAHVYGRRAESVNWVRNASLHGVALDTDFAVDEDPIRVLAVGERPDRALPSVTVCPVSGIESTTTGAEVISEETPAVEAFGEIVYLCNGTHTTIYREQLIYAEGSTGGPIGFTGVLPAAPTPSIGNVRVLVIPLTFADQNDVPSSESKLYEVLRDVGDHYAKASYGKLTLLTTVTPPIKLPHSEAWYIQKDTSNGGTIDGLGLEHSHARAEARKLGFDDADFDCTVVRLRGGPRPAGGYGGGSSVWIYGDSVDVTAHEIGHAFGLAHANFWETAGTSAIGAGTNEEYGGHWDVMGGIGLPNGHYNVQAKNQIRWLPDDYVPEITASGLYRIYAQDQPILDPGKRFALKIRKDSSRTYWGELRGLYTGHATRTWADFGLILGWKFPSAGGSNWQLIDTTPGTAFGKDDSPISLGRTFSDTESGIYLTTVGVNAATATELKSVDVMVNLGEFAGNHAPILSLAASATVVPLNVPVTFTATASDSDGDPLAFSWQHFGDSNYRTISPNAAVITRSFSTAGTYVVTCTASDMRGGTATRQVLITVGNGNGRFTISGRVTLSGVGLEGVLVNANDANAVVTDSDGRYTIPNLSATTYTLSALLAGYNFAELFNNSIVVGPSFEGADFEATETPRVTIAASVPTGTENNTAAPAQFTLTRTGDASQVLTVSVNSPRGTATNNTDYTLSPSLGSGSQGFSTLTFPAGEDTLLVNVVPINDSSAEGPETVILELGPGNGYLLSGLAQSTVVINDDDTALPKVSLTATVAKTQEGSGTPATIIFTRTGATTAALAVPYTVSGTAVNGTDYTTLSGSLTIPAGAASAPLNITSLDDALSESVETVIIRISSSAALIADSVANTATASIVDDDTQVVTLTVTDGTATERDLSNPATQADTATFLVTRQGDLSNPLTVYYAVAGASGGSTATALHGVDYEALPGSVTIPAGQASSAITIIPRWDGLGEGTESVTLQLGAGATNYRLGAQNTGSITIADGGDPVYVEVLGTENAVEGGTSGNFRFSLKGSAAGSVTVNYTVSGTATSGTDFTALSGTVTIPGNGVNTVDVPVVPINDALAEDLESITVTISPNAAYQVFGPSSSSSIWLRDNEQPTVYVDAYTNNYPPSITENGSGASFYLSRTGSTTAALTVNYAMSGTAVNGTDYTTVTGTATIAAGALGVDVAITPTNDILVEGTETITLTLADGAYGKGPAATMYLTDNETPTVQVGFSSAGTAVSESAGSTNIPVTLSASSASPVTVEYLVDTGSRASTTATGSVPAPPPYWVRCARVGNTVTGSISPDGVTWTQVSSQTVAMSSASYQAGLFVCSYNTGTRCTAVFDNVSVTNISPGGSQGARVSTDVGSVAQAGSVSVTGSTYTVQGGGDNVDGTTDQGYFVYFPITNSADCTITARVVSQTNSNAQATAGVMVREGTANNVRRGYMAQLPSGDSEFHYRTAVAATDVEVAVAAPLWLRLQRVGSTLSAFQSSDGATWIQVGSNLDLPLGSEVQAGLAVSSQADGTLATATIDNVTLTPGAFANAVGRTVGLSALQGSDTLAGGVYTIAASGDGVNGTTDDCYFVSSPLTGDFTLSARITGVQTAASNAQAGIMVRETFRRTSRSAYIWGRPSTVPQFISRNSTTTTANGADIDYALTPGVLTFPPGTTTLNIPVTIHDDSIAEPDEVAMVILRNPNNARLGTIAQFALSIVDNDTPPSLAYAGFSAGSSSVAERAGTALIPVSLSVPATGMVTVDYAITAGTATAADFTPATGTITFNVGDTVQIVPVAILEDTDIEPSETVSVTLSNPTGVRLGSLNAHTLTITDNDTPVVTITSSDLSAAETGDTASVVVSRTGSTTAALTVNLSRTGTATAGTDYTGINTTAVIAAGLDSVTLTLNATQDATAEGSETAIIGIASGSGYSVGTPSSVTATILDDDRNTVTIAATTPTAVEGGAAGVFTVTRTGNTTGTLNVSLSATGTATAGTDYTTSPSSITSLAFSAGQTSRTITVTPVNDTATEGDEAVLVQIGSGSYDIGGVGYASVTIQDNDIPPTVFISSPGAQGVVIAPGNGVEFVAEAADDGFPQALTYQWTQIAGPGTIAFGSANATSTPATFSAAGTYLVRVTVSDGQFTVSDQISVNVGGTVALTPAMWISADIGPTTLRGFSGTLGNSWVLSAVGTGYTSDTDRAHAVTRQITGDGTIVARLTGITGATASEGGLSIRDSMHRYARRAALVYQASSSTLRFRVRTTNHTTDTSVSVAGLAMPLWLKLDRVEATDTITASYAPDNAGAPGTWVNIGSASVIAMDATADYSFTGDSGSDTVAASIVLDNISLTPAVSGAGAIAEDFGDGTQAGTFAYNAGTDVYTLQGQGGLDGSGMFYGQSYSGDFILTALQTDATSGATDARSGIMIRDTMDNGAMAFVGRIPTGSYASFVWRTNPKGGTSGLNGITQKKRWLRFIRRGNQITALHAADNSGVPGTWAQLGQPQNVFMGPTVMAGLYCDNAGGVGLNTATFTKLTVVPLNKAPIVDAGTVASPAMSPVSLAGSAIDEGLPSPLTTLWTAASAPGTVVFGNAGNLSTTATFSAGGNYTLRLWGDDGIARTFDDVSFSSSTPFAAWQSANFPGGSSNPLAAALADPDKDGVSNVLEYVCNTNPNSSTSQPGTLSIVTVGPDQYLRLTVTKNPSATDASIVVEGGSNLQPGSWSSAGLVIEQNTSSLLQVRDNIPISSAPSRYLRAKVTLN
jgi:hypothetical protein